MPVKMFNSSNFKVCSSQTKYKNNTTSREEISTYSSYSSYEEKPKVKIPKLLMQTWIDTDVPKK